jgi:hypothetical protein
MVMRNLSILVGGLLLASCGQSPGENAAANNAAANTAATEKPRPAYCFFKDSETKGWAAKRGKDGNMVVTGKAYREDPRYKAQLGPAKVSGTTAEIAPTITVNDTGYAAPGNWWDLKATIANSSAVDTVHVTCGDKTIADLKVAAKG